MTNNNNPISYLTVRQVAKKYPFLTISGWRWKIFSDKEFKKKCVRYFGKKVLLNERKILEFIENSINNVN